MEGLLHYNLDAMWVFLMIGLIAVSTDIVDWVADKVQGWFDDKK